jgi:hypothetical protein
VHNHCKYHSLESSELRITGFFIVGNHYAFLFITYQINGYKFLSTFFYFQTKSGGILAHLFVSLWPSQKNGGSKIQNANLLVYKTKLSDLSTLDLSTNVIPGLFC